jgi:hypothetical protein
VKPGGHKGDDADYKNGVALMQLHNGNPVGQRCRHSALFGLAYPQHLAGLPCFRVDSTLWAA